MKKFICVVICVSIIISMFTLTGFSAGITDKKTPVEYADIIYTKRFGANYKNSPTPPVYSDGFLYVISGRTLYKLNAQNGSEICKTELSSESIYTTVGVAVSGGRVYAALDGGIVEAYDADTLKKLWTYKDPLGGQAITPVTVKDGVVYTGFWNGEEKNANYVALSASCKTEKNKALWTYTHKGGFYWAQCAVTSKHILIGLDDGEDYSQSMSGGVAAVNKKSGKEAAKLTLTGDIRSGISKDGKGNFYTAGKSGFICKFTFDDNKAKFSTPEFFFPVGSVTSTPVIYNNRIYFGSNNYPASYLYVVDALTMKEIYKAPVKGYPQAEVLLSTAYEEETGNVYIYSTYNAQPGGIMIMEDAPGQLRPVIRELAAPAPAFSQYCISPIAAGDNGMLYYKNDSGCIFAVAENISANNLLKNLIEVISRIIAVVNYIFSQLKGK